MKTPEVSRFRGINNVLDPMNMGLEWLTSASNVQITSAGKPQRRMGFAATATMAGTAIAAAYATRDEQHAYLIDAGTLKTGDGVTLSTGLSTDPAFWAEVNDLVFMANGTDALIIRQDEVVLEWAWPVPTPPALAAVTGSLAPGMYRACCTYILPDGRETGPGEIIEIDLAEGQALQLSAILQVAGYQTRTYICAANSDVFGLARRDSATAFVWDYQPTSLGIELRTEGCDPIPAGCTVIQHWMGRVWAALYDPQSDTTVIFPSKSFGFHLFDLGEGIAVTGKVLMLAPTDSALVIGTDRHVWARTNDGSLVKLAHYGVIPGMPWAFDLLEDGRGNDKTVLFWSQRGLCRALPFANLTAGHLSVAPGVKAGAAVIARNGEKHFIANLQAGGSAFNARST